MAVLRRFSPKTVGFGAYRVKLAEARPILSATEMYPRTLVFDNIITVHGNIHGVGPKRVHKRKTPLVKGENVTNAP